MASLNHPDLIGVTRGIRQHAGKSGDQNVPRGGKARGRGRRDGEAPRPSREIPLSQGAGGNKPFGGPTRSYPGGGEIVGPSARS